MVASVVGLLGGLDGRVRLEPGVVATGMSCLGEAVLEDADGWRRLGAIESLSITDWGCHRPGRERCPAESSPVSLMSPAGKAPWISSVIRLWGLPHPDINIFNNRV